MQMQKIPEPAWHITAKSALSNFASLTGDPKKGEILAGRLFNSVIKQVRDRSGQRSNMCMVDSNDIAILRCLIGLFREYDPVMPHVERARAIVRAFDRAKPQATFHQMP